VYKRQAKRQSNRTFDTKELTHQDLSDLLWAANGINRPESKKRTAPSAMNAQDVDIYVCMADGTYLYDASTNCLMQVTQQDIRPFSEGGRSTGAPVILLLVSDASRYRNYKPENKEANRQLEMMGAIDAGIVSQNISLFCAGAGIGTVPRASLDQAAIRKALNLKESQSVWLNHPVGYLKK
jgi:nitroreductase